MIRKQRVVIFGVVTVACLMLGLTAASAQTSGNNITGVVRDATDAVMPGVTVEVSSPALIEKVRTGVTDNQGQYRIISLPPGMYEVTFTLPGFSTVKREGIQLTVNFTATINAQLKVGGVEETITVSGESPVVDVQSTETRNVLSRDVLDTIPTGKTIQGFASLTPGMVIGATGQDVGGSRGDAFLTMTIHGSKTNDAKWNQEGFETNYGPSGRTYIVNPAAQEVSMELGGGSAEAKFGGVQVNAIPKTGSNTVSGDLFGTYTNNNLQNTNLSDAVAARGLTASTINRLDKIWDVNGGLGGPILRDKLWFYTSHRSWGSGTYVAGLYANKTPTALTYTPNLDEPALNDYSGQHHTLRTTWQPALKHRINLSYDFQRRYDLHRDITPLRSPEATDRRSYNPVIVSQATWTYPATNTMLFDGGFSFVSLHANVRRQPGVPDDLPSIRELSNNFTYRAKGGTPSGAGFVYQENSRHKYQSRLSMTYITGPHSFKTGVDWLAERSWDYNTVNADMHFNFRQGRPDSIDVFQTPLEFRQNLNADLGVFAQDQWKINRLMLNLGLRFDYLNQGSPAQHEEPARFRPQAIDFEAVPCGPCYTDLSPRLGASLDVFGNGKTAIKFGLNRYVLGRGGVLNNPATNLVTTANRGWGDANGDFIPQESELGPLNNSNFGKPVINTRYDDSQLRGFGNRQYNWQTMLSLQHELLPNVGVNVGYYRTMWYNFSVTDNVMVSPGDFDQFCLTLPADPRLPGAGQPLCGFYDVKPNLFGRVDNLVVPAENFGKQTEVYDGVDATITARFRNGAFIGGGSSTGRVETDNCFAIDSPQALLFCHNAAPFQTQLKVNGSYPLPLDFNVSGNFQTLPGIPISANYVATRAEVFSSLRRNLNQSTVTLPNIIEPNTQFEGRVNQLDLRLTKNFRVGRTRLQGMFDVYNALNASPILSINTRYGNEWLRPLQILDARLFKLGVQINF
jgi:hypothetical protein